MKRCLLLIVLLGASCTVRSEYTPAELDVLARLRKIGTDFLNHDSDPLLSGLSAFRSRSIDPLEKAKLDIEIRQLMDSLKNDPDNSPSRLIQEMNRERAGDAEEELLNELEHIKWQNTLLTDPDNYVGLYKRDFIETGFLVAEVAADVKLYRMLSNRRIEHVFAALLQDIDGLIEVLKKTNQSEARYDSRLADMSTFAQEFTDQMRSHDILLNPLRRYLDRHHSLITGYIPFNKQTFFPLLARWGMEKVCNWAEGQYLHKLSDMREQSIAAALNPQLALEKVEAHVSAYQTNENGYIRRAEADWYTGPLQGPISVSTIATGLLCFVNPIKGLQKLQKKLTGDLYTSEVLASGSFFGFGVPKFLFSQWGEFGLQVLSIGYSAHFYDARNSEVWERFVLINRDELLRKLLAYRRVLDHTSSGEEAILEAREALREFVMRGHSISTRSGLSQWYNMKANAQTHIQSRLFWAGAAVVATRLGYWWFTRETGQN